MIRRIKFGKIAIVIFLTILIWVWTDLYLDEVLSVPRATISVAPSPELLVSFSGQPEAVITNIELKGPARKIGEVRRSLDAGSLELNFTLNPVRENMTSTGSRTLNVLDFLKSSDKIKELDGLTFEGCEPEIIDVGVVKLVKKSLEIDCFDENGVPVTVQSIEPEKIDMYVPEGSRLKAQVRLTSSNINQAMLSQAIVYPFVELAPGQRRSATQPVRVKMSPEADSLTEHNIEDAKIGITLGMNLIGEYDVEITNYNELVLFPILATQEAKSAYENQVFQMFLIIPDDYAKRPNEEQHIEVVYNFPEKYVRRNEIQLKGEPDEAEFKLKPLKSVEVSASGTN